MKALRLVLTSTLPTTFVVFIPAQFVFIIVAPYFVSPHTI